MLESEFFEELEGLHWLDSSKGNSVVGVVIGVAATAGELATPFMQLFDVERQVVAVLFLSGTTDRADLSVPLLGDFDADVIGNVVTLNAIGTLAVGHPVALEYGGQRIYPAGPARLPSRPERRAAAPG